MMESPDPALERSFRGHRDRVNAVAFNPNMKQLVTASDDAAVMVWHFRPTLRAFRFIGHKAAVLSVAVSAPEPEPEPEMPNPKTLTLTLAVGISR